MVSRRHVASSFGRALLLLAPLALMGSTCLDVLDGGEERARCEEVCAAEASCELGRSEAECLAALCTPLGFRTVDDEPTEEDADAGVIVTSLGDLQANDCMRLAEDCAELALCSCPDACTRVDECTGDPDGACVDTCETLLEQDTATYLENRCKMESACVDLAACGGVSG